MISETELAWAAGLFDGEGTVFPWLTSCRLSITQAGNKEVLSRFREAVNLGKVYGPYRYKARQRQPFWIYVVTNREAIFEIADLLWPWLSSIKKTQFNRVLNEY